MLKTDSNSHPSGSNPSSTNEDTASVHPALKNALSEASFPFSPLHPSLKSTASLASAQWSDEFFTQQFVLREKIVQQLSTIEIDHSVAQLRLQVLNTPNLPLNWRQDLLAIQPPEQAWEVFENGKKLQGWYGPVWPTCQYYPDILYVALDKDDTALVVLYPKPFEQVDYHRLERLEPATLKGIREAILLERQNNTSLINEKLAELKKGAQKLSVSTFAFSLSRLDWETSVFEALTAQGIVYPVKAPVSWKTPSTWYEEERLRRQATVEKRYAKIQTLITEGECLKQKDVVECLNAVAKAYVRYQSTLATVSPQEWREVMNPCGRVRGVDIEGMLTKESHQVLFDHSPEDIFSAEHRASTKSKNIVKPRAGLYFKFFRLDGDSATNFPAMAHAVHSLHQVLAQQGTAVSQLVLFSRGPQRYPTLVSEGVKGMTLEDWLKREEVQHFTAKDFRERLDPLNFSVMVLLSLLTRPQDAKWDNYVLQEVPATDSSQPSRWRMVNIDADHAFSDWLMQWDTWSKNKRRAKFNVRDVVYGFPQMGDAVHPELRKRVAAWEPECVLTEWLYALMLQYQTDQALVTQDVLTAEEMRQLQLPLLLRPDTLSSVYETLKALVQCCRQSTSTLTHWDWMTAVAPHVSAAYQEMLHTVLRRAPTLAKDYGVSLVPATPPEITVARFDEHTESGRKAKKDLDNLLEWQTPATSVVEVIRQFFSGVWNAPLEHPAPEKLPDDVFYFLDARTQPLPEAIETWFSTLDWSQLEASVSQRLTTWVMRFPGLTRLSFRGNPQLTGAHVQGLLLNQSLQALDLVGCRQVDAVALKVFCAALRGRSFQLTVDVKTFEAWPGLLAAVERLTVDFQDGVCWKTNRGAQWTGGFVHALKKRSVRGVVFFREQWMRQQGEEAQAWKEMMLNEVDAKTGQTPLHVVCQQQGICSTLAEVGVEGALALELIQAGANVNAWNTEGRTPFLQVAKNVATAEARADEELADLMMKVWMAMWPLVAWESVNAQGESVLSLWLESLSLKGLAFAKMQVPLFSMTQKNHWLAACQLMSQQRKTVVHAVAGNPHPEVLEWLLTFGPVPTLVKMNNPEGRLGYTPLHIASGYGHVAVVTKLLQAGAKPIRTVGGGLWPSDVAKNKRQQQRSTLSDGDYDTLIMRLAEAEQQAVTKTPLSQLTRLWVETLSEKAKGFFKALQTAENDKDIRDDSVFYGEKLPLQGRAGAYALIRSTNLLTDWTLYQADASGHFQKQSLGDISGLKSHLKNIPKTLSLDVFAASQQREEIDRLLTQYQGAVVVKWRRLKAWLQTCSVAEQAALCQASLSQQDMNIWHVLAEGPISFLPDWRDEIEQRLQMPHYQNQLKQAEQLVVDILMMLKAALHQELKAEAAAMWAEGLRAISKKSQLTPLHLAVQSRRPAVLSWFLEETPREHCLEPDRVTGNTVFHWAMGQVGGRFEVIDVLLKWSLKTQTFGHLERELLRPNFQGNRPLYQLFDKVPRVKGQEGRADTLAAHRKELKDYQQAVLKLLQGPLEKMDFTQARGRDGKTLLQVVVANGCGILLSELLKHIPAQTVDDEGQTVLHDLVFSVFNGRYPLDVQEWQQEMQYSLKALAENGLDLDSRDVHGQTALEAGRVQYLNEKQRLERLDYTPAKEQGLARLKEIEIGLMACEKAWQEARKWLRNVKVRPVKTSDWFVVRKSFEHLVRVMQLYKWVWHNQPVWTTGLLRRTHGTRLMLPDALVKEWTTQVEALRHNQLGNGMKDACYRLYECARKLEFWCQTVLQSEEGKTGAFAAVVYVAQDTALTCHKGIEMLLRVMGAPEVERQRCMDELNRCLRMPIKPGEVGEVLWQESRIRQPRERRPLVGKLVMATVIEIMADETMGQTLEKARVDLGHAPADDVWQAWLGLDVLSVLTPQIPWFKAAMRATDTPEVISQPSTPGATHTAFSLPSTPDLPKRLVSQQQRVSIVSLAKWSLFAVQKGSQEDFKGQVNGAYEYEDIDINVILGQLVKQQGLSASCEVLAAADTLSEDSVKQRLQTGLQHYCGKTWLIPYNLGGYHWTGLLVTVTPKGELTRAVFVDPLGEMKENPSYPKEVQSAFRDVFGEKGVACLHARMVRRQPDSTSCGPVVIDSLVRLARLDDAIHSTTTQALTGEDVRHLRATHLAVLHRYRLPYYHVFVKKQRDNVVGVAPLAEQQAWLAQIKPLKFSPEEMARIARIQQKLSVLHLHDKSLEQRVQQCFQVSEGEAIEPKAYCERLRKGFQKLWSERETFSSEAQEGLHDLVLEVMRVKPPIMTDSLAHADLRLAFEECLAIGQQLSFDGEKRAAREKQIKADEVLAQQLQAEEEKTRATSVLSVGLRHR